jgi:two-component system phosphate regulon sensor histidine kinase PhoR
MRSLSHQLEQTMSLLGKERDRFAAVVQAMDYAVLALDPEQRVTTVNEAARSLLGIEAAGEGRKLLEVVRIPALTELVTNASKEVGQRIEFDSHGVVNRRLRAHANRLPDGGVVVVLHDLTELRRLERVRRDFVAAVSHELRTPISVIKANAETLLEGGLEHPVAGRGFAEAIARHSDRLAAMVEDLLDISRVEAGRYPLTMRRIDLQPVVAQVCELMTSRAAEAQAELVDAIDGPVWVEGDDKAAEHVLLNLVDNALKYGGSGNRVEISRSIRGEAVRVEVRDAGPGVDPKHQPRLFERFYRVDSGRSRDRGGTGLGLAIVRNLVEAMGGTVGVRSGGSRGSVFWFELRRAETGGADSAESAG